MKKTKIILLIILISHAAFAQVPSYVPTNGLVGWWPFNGNANDLSINGRNGVLTGGQYTADRNGSANGALLFNSTTTGYVDINIGSNLVNQFTVSLWVRADRTSTYNTESNICYGSVSVPLANTNQNWAMIPANGGSNFGIGISAVQNGIMVGEHANNVLVSRLSSTNSNASFNNIIIVYRLDSIFMYINGTLNRSRASYCSASTKSIYSSVRLGGSLYSPNFAGAIDEFGIWNRALSAAEIQQLYTTQVPCTLTNNFFATDTVSACGNSVSLNAQNTGANYLWSNNATTQSITANATGWYKCTVSQGTTCSVSDSVYVKLSNALPAALQSGLVGYWPFCGNANDESGNGNNGTVNGATLTTDRYGNQNNAYNFNGSSSIVVPSANSLNLTSFTISGWVYLPNFNASCCYEFLTKGCDLSENYELLIYGQLNPGAVETSIRFTDGSRGGTGYSGSVNNCMQVISSNSWQFISSAYDSNTGYLKTYINGIPNCNDLISKIPQINNSNLVFGTDPCVGRSMLGAMDDICIWNRALSPNEMQLLYSAQSNSALNNTNGSGSNSSSNINNIPKGISYQAVARDSAGIPLSNANVEVRFTLRDSSITGPVVYKEVHTLTTNQFGLFTTAIGSGTAQTGDYNTINWMGPAKYLDVEIKQGANYLLMGSQQLLAVPYANAAISAGKIKNAQVPVYADNTAALAGGLQVGDMYRTPSGALMIVY